MSVGSSVRRYGGTGVRRWIARTAGIRSRMPVRAGSPLSRPRTFALSHCRKGAVLLEAIVALVILTVAGTSAVVLVSQSADAVRRARMADAEAREASAFLHAVSLWTREDLDRRLGDRPQGEWRLIIQRPSPTLYEVVLTDSAATHEILRTALFRPEPPRRELPWTPTPGGLPQPGDMPSPGGMQMPAGMPPPGGTPMPGGRP